ncbi:MAG TPA: sugar ABC transporter ATP-binding protein, partial [Fimbriimonas sp.]|nr:sugar ABC transporter ATP-binding protein [Fimbriimonas sp.]
LLSGVITPSQGTVIVNGEPARFHSPRDASRLGIEIVHQELNLIPTLSVEDNLFLGSEIGRVTVDRAATRARAQELLDRVGATFSPSTLCEELSVAEQQLVEIAKAVSKDAQLIIFDEPTAVLSHVESEKLFELIEGLRDDGVAVLYVSHRLPEVLRLCSRIVVLRDGVLVGDQPSAGLSERDLANMMVGRKLEDIYPPKTPCNDTVVLSASSVSFPGAHNEVSFEVRQGEILGFSGLIGSGRTEVAEAIFGVRPRKGVVDIDGQPLQSGSVKASQAAGVAYVSEDRKGRGLVTSMSINENIALATLRTLRNTRLRSERAEHWIKELAIKVPDAELPMTSLSGGNQQKCSIAKWLQTEPRVIILDEPTRGVDVGAKAEIYRIIADLAKSGLACIVISSEMPELIGLCHRVLVFRENAIVGELNGDEITEQAMMALAAGMTEQVA